MGLLVAGTKYRGEFEERLKKLMEEIKQVGGWVGGCGARRQLAFRPAAGGVGSGQRAWARQCARPCLLPLPPASATPPLPGVSVTLAPAALTAAIAFPCLPCSPARLQNDDIILMIDEVHTLIGAGAAEGAIDAANILKPALARGELQCIGATTLDEYRKHIEKDPALERCVASCIALPGAVAGQPAGLRWSRTGWSREARRAAPAGVAARLRAAPRTSQPAGVAARLRAALRTSQLTSWLLPLPHHHPALSPCPPPSLQSLPARARARADCG